MTARLAVPSLPYRFLSAGLASCALGLVAHAENTAPSSPFLPPPDAPALTPAAAIADYEFVGMTTFGEQTLLGIVRATDQRSFWIPLGRMVNGITAVSYDAKSDRAVIRADDKTYTLSMRQSAIVPLGSAAATAPTITASGVAPAGVTAAPLTPQQEKEMEARMLVTDLLEIGQQQRKAYEEAQRQAAARAQAAANAAPPSTAPSPAAASATSAVPPTK